MVCMAFESEQSVSESVSQSVSEVGIELLGQLKKSGQGIVVKKLSKVFSQDIVVKTF